MIIVIGVVIGILWVPMTGGSLRHLDFMAFNGGIWLALAAALQIAMFQFPDGTLPRVLHIASFGAAGVFLASNTLRGLAWARLGGALNLAAIVLNRGVMPARPDAWSASGLPVPGSGTFLNARPTDSLLGWIGDCIAMPAWFPGAAPFSIGDLMIAFGVGVALRHACGTSGTLLPSWRRQGSPDEQWWWHLGNRSAVEQSTPDRRRIPSRSRKN